MFACFSKPKTSWTEIPKTKVDHQIVVSRHGDLQKKNIWIFKNLWDAPNILWKLQKTAFCSDILGKNGAISLDLINHIES